MTLPGTTLVTFEAELTPTMRLVCEIAVDGPGSIGEVVFTATQRLNARVGTESRYGHGFAWTLADVQDL